MIAENDNFCATPRPRRRILQRTRSRRVPASGAVRHAASPRCGDDRQAHGGRIDRYILRGEFVDGRGQQPILGRTDQAGAQDQGGRRATLCALDISRCRDRMPGNRTGTCSTLHVRCARMRALIITPDHCIACVRRCMHFLCLTLPVRVPQLCVRRRRAAFARIRGRRTHGTRPLRSAAAAASTAVAARASRTFQGVAVRTCDARASTRTRSTARRTGGRRRAATRAAAARAFTRAGAAARAARTTTPTLPSSRRRRSVRRVESPSRQIWVAGLTKSRTSMRCAEA